MVPLLPVSYTHLLLPVPLVYINAVQVVKLFVAADGVHVGHKALAGAEPILMSISVSAFWACRIPSLEFDFIPLFVFGNGVKTLYLQIFSHKHKAP